MKLTIKDGRDHFYTFDTNRILILTATDEDMIKQVEFSTEENGEEVSWTSEVLTGSDGVKYVQVPNEFLNGDYTRLVCYYVALDSNGEYTRQKEIFRIRARQEPQDYYLTYSERVTFASIKALTEQYKSNASDSADLASKYAENNEDVAVEPGKYSAKHWSIKANKKYEEIRSYVGSASDPESALGSIESARANAVSDVEKQETDSIEAVGTYTSNTAIPSVSQYVEGTAKPALKTYGEQQVDSYVNGTSKPELDRYVNNDKKQVLDEYTAEKKTELDIYTSVDKKQVLDSYTENEKKTELDSHTVGLKEQLDAHTVAKAGDLNEHTTSLKGTLDGYTTAKEQDISEFTEQKKQEVQGVYENDLNELKGDLVDLLMVLDDSEYRVGFYSSNGNFDTTNTTSNRTSRIISSEEFRTIRIKPKTGFICNYALFDGETFISRGSWSNNTIELDNTHSVAIMLATQGASSLDTEAVLSNFDINITKLIATKKSINALEDRVIMLEDGLDKISLDKSYFKVGFYNSDGKYENTSSSTSLTTSKIISSEDFISIKVKPKQGFLVNYALFDGVTFVSRGSWTTNSIELDNSKSVAIMLCTQAGSETTLDIETMVSNFEIEVITKEKEIDNEISILFVGNSMTQDGIAYMPYILKKYYPEVKFRFYIFYTGGYTLAQQYQKFIDDTPCAIFSIAENYGSWDNVLSSVKMSDVLRNYKFDIVCLQEYFNGRTEFTESDLVHYNNCQDYIVSNYTGGNPLEFITYFHAPERSTAEDTFNLTKQSIDLILRKTTAVDFLPVGVSIYLALSTELDSLGDSGHLSPDGAHAQEGIPSLMQAYVGVLWLLDKLSINKSIYGCNLRITSDIYEFMNVPGPNLGSGVITGTDEQNLLAQRVAIQAYKFGKYITNQVDVLK